jgi:hypothetical protein
MKRLAILVEYMGIEQFIKMKKRMKKTKLEPVTLQKHDTCFTYALKRARREVFNYNSSDDYIMNANVSVDRVHDLRGLEKGDVLMYKLSKDDTTIVEVASEIDEDGKVTWNDVKFDKHFMVYEGEGMISEAVIEYNKMFSIQFRSIEPYLSNHKLFKISYIGDIDFV